MEYIQFKSPQSMSQAKERNTRHSKLSNLLGLGPRAWCSPLHAKLLCTGYFPRTVMSVNAISTSMSLFAALLFELPQLELYIAVQRTERFFFPANS